MTMEMGAVMGIREEITDRAAGLGPRRLIAVAVALFAAAAVALAAGAVPRASLDEGAASVLWGLAADALVAAGAACLARARSGAAPGRAMGRVLVAAGLAGFALLAAAYACTAWHLASVGAPQGVAGLYLKYARVPPFELVAALLPVGACLSCGGRGRAAAYAVTAALAVAGFALCVLFGVWAPESWLYVGGPEPVALPLGAALLAPAVGMVAPRLVALALGLAVAAWMESAARRTASPGEPPPGAGAAPCGAVRQALWLCTLASFAVAFVLVAYLLQFVRLGSGEVALSYALSSVPWPAGLAAVGAASVAVCGRPRLWRAGLAVGAVFAAAVVVAFAAEVLQPMMGTAAGGSAWDWGAFWAGLALRMPGFLPAAGLAVCSALVGGGADGGRRTPGGRLG